MDKVKSYAGSDAMYVVVDDTDFRIRSLEDGNVRIHIGKDFLRDRPDYVAVDIDATSLLAAIDAALV